MWKFLEGAAVSAGLLVRQVRKFMPMAKRTEAGAASGMCC